MRFFKSLPGFLHRRSKSDSSIPKPAPARDHILNRPQSLDTAQAAVFAAAVPTCPQTFLFPAPADASNAVFELETANSRLRNDVSALAGECAQLRSQLDATRADLFTQLHRNTSIQRQAQADKSELDAVNVKLVQYERFLGLMISVGLHQRVLGDAHAALRAGIDPDAALVDAIKEAAAIPGSPWSTIIPSVTGPRTPDEYRSSLTLTLKTRKELRDARKVAKFWKRVAQEDGQKSGIVTPSVSAISSIHEPLSAERQKAVEELISTRRRASLGSQVGSIDPASVPVPTSASSSTSSSVSSTSVSLDVALTPDITPSNSGSELPPCLSPLASESFKSELASLSSNTRLFKRGPPSGPKPNRPPLGQKDMNVTSRNASQPRTKLSVKRRAGGRDENTPQPQPQARKVTPPAFNLRPRARELPAPNVVPSFSKHSLCSNLLGPLGRIEEEREDFDFVSIEAADAPDNGNISQDSNWSMLDFPDHDLSLSFCDMSASTAPTTPEKEEEEVEVTTPTKTSRLPKPVLKQLNRMSTSKPVKTPQIMPLVIKKPSMGGPSTTRLPVSVRGRRSVVRA